MMRSLSLVYVGCRFAERMRDAKDVGVNGWRVFVSGVIRPLVFICS